MSFVLLEAYHSAEKSHKKDIYSALSYCSGEFMFHEFHSVFSSFGVRIKFNISIEYRKMFKFIYSLITLTHLFKVDEYLRKVGKSRFTFCCETLWKFHHYWIDVLAWKFVIIANCAFVKRKIVVKSRKQISFLKFEKKSFLRNF